MSNETLRSGLRSEIVEIISFLKQNLPTLLIDEQDVLESFAELFSNYVVTTDKTKEVLLKRLILVLYIANDEKELDIMDLMKNELYRQLVYAMELDRGTRTFPRHGKMGRILDCLGLG